MSNGLDQDQDRLFVCPDLGPNCLQRLSSDGTSRYRVQALSKQQKYKALLQILQTGVG